VFSPTGESQNDQMRQLGARSGNRPSTFARQGIPSVPVNVNFNASTVHRPSRSSRLPRCLGNLHSQRQHLFLAGAQSPPPWAPCPSRSWGLNLQPGSARTSANATPNRFAALYSSRPQEGIRVLGVKTATVKTAGNRSGADMERRSIADRLITLRSGLSSSSLRMSNVISHHNRPGWPRNMDFARPASWVRRAPDEAAHLVQLTAAAIRILAARISGAPSRQADLIRYGKRDLAHW